MTLTWLDWILMLVYFASVLGAGVALQRTTTSGGVRAERRVFLMRLDVRFPVGVMFGIMGGLLAAYGALGDRAVYQRSLGVNINLDW